MADPQRVIDESRPMLEEFLCDLGLHSPGDPLDLKRTLRLFSDWVDAQEVTDEDIWFLSSRLAAFICEYLIDNADGQRFIENGRIMMRLPVDTGLFREFDPYAAAVGMARNRNSLREFLEVLCS